MDFHNTPEYKSLRSSVPLRKVVVEGNVEWSYYDAGPKTIHNPLVFLPPVSGTADIYFRQLLSLSATGCRAISVNHPVVWDVPSWCQSFHLFLNSLGIDRVHLFGASLGGFLAQKFAEFSGNGRRVRSLILCNAFNDTDVFDQTSACSSFWAVPAVVLKKLVMGTFETMNMDGSMVAAADFMVQKLDALSQQELASRLTLNCVSCYVEPQNVQVLSSDVTLMSVFDQHALSNSVQNEMSKLYPEAKKALLKTGGNFPYLSRSDEVNLYIQVHLQKYADTVYSATEPRQFLPLPSNPSTSSSKPSTSAAILTDSDSDSDNDVEPSSKTNTPVPASVLERPVTSKQQSQVLLEQGLLEDSLPAEQELQMSPMHETAAAVTAAAAGADDL